MNSKRAGVLVRLSLVVAAFLVVCGIAAAQNE